MSLCVWCYAGLGLSSRRRTTARESPESMWYTKLWLFSVMLAKRATRAASTMESHWTIFAEPARNDRSGAHTERKKNERENQNNRNEKWHSQNFSFIRMHLLHQMCHPFSLRVCECDRLPCVALARGFIRLCSCVCVCLNERAEASRHASNADAPQKRRTKR